MECTLMLGGYRLDASNALVVISSGQSAGFRTDGKGHRFVLTVLKVFEIAVRHGSTRNFEDAC